MKILSRDLKDITEFKLGFKGVIVLLLLVAAYFACYLFLPQKMRYLLIATIAMMAAFQVKSNPGFWLPVLPVVFMAGGSTIPLGEFYPAIATIAMMIFSFFYIIDRLLWNKSLFVPSRYLLFLFLAIFIQAGSVFISIHLHGQPPEDCTCYG